MKKIVLAAAVLTVFGATGAFAQAATANLSGIVEQSLYIALDGPGQTVTFANSVAADFNNGYKQVSAGVLTHAGNVTHTVSVKADAATMAFSPNGREDKPASDVSWSIDEFTFYDLSTANASVATLVDANTYSKNLSYRMKLQWHEDKPGTYGLAVTYTIAPN